ncbi:MAG: Gfo/Idh/MocA family oxidoreductase [Lentisphaeria bacterium]|nr:Gfo/Idh/MocA family oxidoreductase [Lentisphaeria bacterium]
MAPIKVGIIGMGIMGNAHFKILKAQNENYQITAVCDIDPAKLSAEELQSVARFNDYRELINSGLCELVAMATPHPCHGEISIAAFEKGLHVMCEKPLTETAAKTDALLAAAGKAGTVFSTNFSMRTIPINKMIRKMLSENALGKIIRVDFVCTRWMRSQRYYDMQSWRGSWAGEGGGVLMNQAPHNLDLLHWWFGEMASVRGKLAMRLHDIDTEDEVEATFISKQGFPIRFYANTGELPGIDRIEIVGEKGTLIREVDKLVFQKLEKTVSEWMAGEEAFPAAVPVIEELPIPDDPQGAAEIWKNIASVIRQGGELIAPGADAWAAVELANGITISHFTNREVKFPVDRKEYAELLGDLIEGKKGLK